MKKKAHYRSSEMVSTRPITPNPKYLEQKIEDEREEYEEKTRHARHNTYGFFYYMGIGFEILYNKIANMFS